MESHEFVRQLRPFVLGFTARIGLPKSEDPDCTRDTAEDLASGTRSQSRTHIRIHIHSQARAYSHFPHSDFREEEAKAAQAGREVQIHNTHQHSLAQEGSNSRP